MIARPNVRARCFQPNLQARCTSNRKYSRRSYAIYVKSCRWCRRPVWGGDFTSWPNLCNGCIWYLTNLNAYCHIQRGQNIMDHPPSGPKESFLDYYYPVHITPRRHTD